MAVIHTAAVVKDSLIRNLSIANFEDPVKPKLVGAWNLHTATVELHITLESFVLLSSIRFGLVYEHWQIYF